MPAVARAGGWLVMFLSFGAMVFIAATLLPPPGDWLNASMSAAVSLVVGWLILLSVSLGLACLATARDAAPEPWFGNHRLGARVTSLGTVALLLMPLATAVLMDVRTHTGVGPDILGPRAWRAYLWCALAVSLVLVVRAQTGTSRPMRTVQYCAASILLTIGSALALIDSGSVSTATLVVADPIAAMGLVALVAVPAVVLYRGVEGLQDIRRRTGQLAAVVEYWPSLTMVVVALKLVMILGLLGLGPWLRPGSTWLASSVPVWLFAIAVAVVMVGVFVLDHHVQVQVADHGTVGRVLGAMIGIALGLLVVWAVLASLLQRPVISAALVLLLGTAWVGRHRIRTAGLWLSCPVALLIGTGLSFASAIPGPRALSMWRPPSPDDAIQVGIFLAVIIALCVLGVVVLRLLNKNVRMLLHLTAIAVWVALSVFTSRLAPGLTLLNLDIVMLVLVSVAAASWLTGRQTQVDGFDIVALVVVTFTVWEVPLFAQLLPTRWAPGLLAIAAVGPAFVVIAKEGWRIFSSPRASPDWRRLGTVCVLYALLSAMVWSAGVPAMSLMDSIGSLVEAYLLVPLALLLLISVSLDHTRVPPG